MPNKIFISHATADDNFVTQLRKALEYQGFDVWIDSRNMRGGDILKTEIESAIKDAAAFIVVISNSTTDSEWVLEESHYAQDVLIPKKIPVVPILIDGKKPAAVKFLFKEELLAIEIKNNLQESMPQIRAALRKEAPTDIDPEIVIEDAPIEALILNLTDPKIQETEGKKRAIATAKLIYRSSSTRDIESKRFVFTAPLGPIEMDDLEWYLERYHIWPSEIFQKKAKRIEDKLPQWGKDLFQAAMPPLCENVLQGWYRVQSDSDRRFSVLVDDELPDGAQTQDQRMTKQAATLLLSLPWELLHDGRAYVMMGAKPLIVRRQLVNRESFDVFMADPPVRVLLVSPRPEDEAAGYIDHRASALPLVQALDRLGDKAELTILTPPTFDALERVLSKAYKAKKPFHVVHFDGHGVFQKDIGLGGLCFESPEPVSAFDKRRSDIINSDKMAAILRDHRIPLVFLDACQTATSDIEPATSVAAALLDNGIASVVAMTHSVLVVTAQKFVTDFYKALVQGERVGDCMSAGQKVLYKNPDRGTIFGAGKLELQDWFVPILLQEKDDPRLFKRLPSETMQKDQQTKRKKQMGELKAAPDHSFVGRSRELLSLERLLSEKSFAIIQGEGGEGKTTLAVELARWLVLTARMDQAVFVSVEDLSDVRSIIDSIGKQLLNNYSVAEFGEDIWDTALQPIDRKLKENRTVIVFDNMESIIPQRHGSMIIDHQIIEDLYQLSHHLLCVTHTRIIFTTREPLPEPFNKTGQICHLGRLPTTDAIKLVNAAMKQAQCKPKENKEPEDGSPDPDVERLVESVNCHARSLVLLAPNVEKLGVDKTGDALNKLMAELNAQYPNDRERSLYASVELSLRRLPEDVRQSVNMLAVFHGGVNARVWSTMSDQDESMEQLVKQLLANHSGKEAEFLEKLKNSDPSAIMELLSLKDQTESQSPGISFQKLQTELTRTGLAQAYPHGHMRLHPALSPYLKTQPQLSSDHIASAQKKWAQGMKSLAKFLYDQHSENTQLSAELTLLELSNLMALLDYTRQKEQAEEIVDIAGDIEGLLQFLGRRQILQQVVAVREKAEKGLKAWNNTSFNAAKHQIERLLEKGSLGPAQTAAQDLLKKSLDAGEDAYPLAAYNIGMANLLLGRILEMSGASEPALTYLESARTQFDRLGQDGNKNAQRMASACLTEQGDCLRSLGRLDEAAAAYEERIALAEKLGDLRGAAVGKGNLGWVRLDQKQYAEALTAYESAIQSFESLGEPASVATIWHQMGMVHEASNNYPAAETAYRKSLGIWVQQNIKDHEASSLGQLGNLFDKMGQLEDAVTFYRQAVDIRVALGDMAKEGAVRNNLADTFIKLKRYDDARQEILRAIECKKPFGHTALPWTAWQILSTIEQAQGNAAAAKNARDQAVALYMAFRRSGGGKYEYGAQLCDMVGDAIQHGARAEVEAAFGQFGEDYQPLIDALRQILDGVRDVQGVEGLYYRHEVDVRLLLEQLGGKKRKPSLWSRLKSKFSK
jgi:tetratricopeptide (TPR) repeat protein